MNTDKRHIKLIRECMLRDSTAFFTCTGIKNFSGWKGEFKFIIIPIKGPQEAICKSIVTQ